MQKLRRLITILIIGFFCLSSTIGANAESNQDTLHNAEQQKRDIEKNLEMKEIEKEEVLKQTQNVQKDLQSIQEVISTNNKELEEIEQKIKGIYQDIEEKKEEIIILEDKVYAREDIMEKRLIALQHQSPTNIVIESIVHAESLTDLIDRVGAVATLLNADNDILEAQQNDLQKIEKEKEEIVKQEQQLAESQNNLALKQKELNENLEKRQVALQELQNKYTNISNDIVVARAEQQDIESKITDIQNSLKLQQEAREQAEKRAAELAKLQPSTPPAVQPASTKSTVQTTKALDESKPKETVAQNTAINGKELYVSATAYSHEDTASDYTALGYNIKKNANMKLIAVDPNIIPLGSKVWVEGYGTAIAGDTGGAIKGHKIDVLMPSSQAAFNWGRKSVKIVILN